MKSNNHVLIFIVLLAVVLVASLLFAGSGGKKINWEENYRKDNKDPFGCYVLFELLKENHEEKVEIIDQPAYLALNPSDTGNNYVFIGGSLFLGEKDQDSLLRFVASGNTAFISAKNYPQDLMDALVPNHCNEWNGHHTYHDSIVSMNFNHVSLTTDSGYTYRVPLRKGTFFLNTYNWQGTNGDYFCDSVSVFISVGYIRGNEKQGDYLNFLKIPYGAGSFYFHTTPVVFTNYYLKSKEGVEYAEKALSHISPGKIYWDEFSQTPYVDESQTTQSPIKMILDNPSLRFAWYLLITLVILYLIFFAKRKQRAIPVLAANINTSLEFVRTIGRLYFQQQNHRHLLKLKQKLFNLYVWQRYGISTSDVTEHTIQLIAKKSNVPQENVKAIFEEMKTVNRYDLKMEPEDVFRIHSHLEFFYKNCK